MAPRSGEPGSAPLRRFFLARSPAEGAPELLPEDARHALRVLRVRVGDRLIGLDGRGGAWPLSVASVARDLEVRPDGEVRSDPPPGSDGASLPWIEVALSWPKADRSAAMLDRLTQLGAAAIAELSTARSAPGAGLREGAPRRRAERILREACKQSGRTWLPELREAPSPAPAERILLDPSADLDLASWAARSRDRSPTLWTRDRPLAVIVGPEGGFAAAEVGGFVDRGAVRLRLGPHTLRIETAAEAAMAILAGCLLRPPRA